MIDLLAQTDASTSPTTLAGMLLGCIAILSGVIAKMWSMFLSDKEKTIATFVEHSQAQEAKFASAVKEISEKHDQTTIQLNTNWREERDRDRARADHREEQMVAAIEKLADKLPDPKG